MKTRPQIAGLNVVAFVLLLMMCFTSCVPLESLIYLQPDGETSTEAFGYNKQEYRLQMNDILMSKSLLQSRSERTLQLLHDGNHAGGASDRTDWW